MTKIAGWINIYKPTGISSAKVVALVKKNLPKGVKIGHAGTLDVEAEGVLPIAIGSATKLIRFAQDATKEYKFEVKFGSATDTADASGAIIDSTDYIPSKKEAQEICNKFLGKIKQVPPIYSAIKVNGKRAYDLARQGEDFKLKEREISIYSLEMLDYNLEFGSATYHTTCSKGTYIRTLAEDISLSLKSLGYVLSLARIRVGVFDVTNAITLPHIADLNLEALLEFIQPMEVVLDDIPVVEVDVDIAQKIIFGRQVTLEVPDCEQIWIRYKGSILAVGSVNSSYFDSERVLKVELD